MHLQRGKTSNQNKAIVWWLREQQQHRSQYKCEHYLWNDRVGWTTVGAFFGAVSEYAPHKKFQIRSVWEPYETTSHTTITQKRRVLISWAHCICQFTQTQFRWAHCTLHIFSVLALVMRIRFRFDLRLHPFSAYLHTFDEHFFFFWNRLNSLHNSHCATTKQNLIFQFTLSFRDRVIKK